MMVQVIIGACFGVVAFLLGNLGLTLEGTTAVLLLWTSFATLMGCLAITLNMPQLLGKYEGRLSPLATLATLPLLLIVHGLWWGRRSLSNEAIFNRVTPELYVGRRPLNDELPEAVTCIVDLTCEFWELASVRKDRDYRCMPTIDGSVPPSETEFCALVDELADLKGTLYVHCAYGHGRAALMSAAILIRQGHATDAVDAFRMLKEERPGIRPNRHQRQWLEGLKLAPSS